MDDKIIVIKQETLSGISNAIDQAYENEHNNTYSTSEMIKAINELPLFWTEKVLRDVAENEFGSIIVAGNLIYQLQESGTNYTCIGYYDQTSSQTDYSVLSQFGNSGRFCVNKIGEKAFKLKKADGSWGGGSQEIISVTLPGTIKLATGNNGDSRIFQGCSNLKNVVFEEGFTTMSYMMFDNCTSLSEVILPNSLLTIDEYALKGTSLNELTIPDSVTSIKAGAFTSKTIQKVYFGSGTKDINRVFIPTKKSNGTIDLECSALTDIYVPWSASEKEVVLEGVPNEVTIHYNYNKNDPVEPTLAYELSDDGTYYTLVGRGTIPETVTDIVIDSEYNGLPVTMIGSEAFANTSITSVTIPKSISHILPYAFSGCNSLTDVYYEGNSVEWSQIDNYAENFADNITCQNDKPVKASIDSSYETYPGVDTSQKINTDGLEIYFSVNHYDNNYYQTHLIIRASSDYAYDSFYITNEQIGPDFEYIKVDLSPESISKMYYESYVAETHGYPSWDDLSEANAPVTSFIYQHYGQLELGSNIADYLLLFSDINQDETADITYTIKLDEIPDNSGSIYLIDSKDKSYVQENIGNLKTISESFTVYNLNGGEIFEPLWACTRNANLIQNKLLRFVAQNISDDSISGASYYESNTEYLIGV